MKCYVLNGWAAEPDMWNACTFPCERIFSYVEQLDGVPERVLAEETDVVLVGWSMGGSSALRLALRFPEKLRGLVLVAATARMMEEKAVGWAGMSERRIQALLAGARMMNEEVTSPALDETTMLRGIDYLRETDVRQALLDGVTEGSPLASLPVRIFQGTRDGVVRPQNAAFLKRVFPQAVVTMVEQAEHALPTIVPDGISAAVLELLER